MRLEQVLFSQGFGTRHECRGLIALGQVAVKGEVVDDPDADIDVESLDFTVKGETWPYREKALLMMNKPAGYECSQKPIHHPSIMQLLSPPLRCRGVQPVGRHIPGFCIAVWERPTYIITMITARFVIINMDIHILLRWQICRKQRRLSRASTGAARCRAGFCVRCSQAVMEK